MRVWPVAFFLLIATGVLCCIVGLAMSETPQTDLVSVLKALNATALDLYGKLAVQKGNLFFSPDTGIIDGITHLKTARINPEISQLSSFVLPYLESQRSKRLIVAAVSHLFLFRHGIKALNRRNPGIKVISIKTMMPLSAGIG